MKNMNLLSTLFSYHMPVFPLQVFIYNFNVVLQRTDSNGQYGNYYGKQGYGGGYGYAVPQTQDPSMYAAAAYGVPSNGYGNH